MAPNRRRRPRRRSTSGRQGGRSRAGCSSRRQRSLLSHRHLLLPAARRVRWTTYRPPEGLAVGISCDVHAWGTPLPSRLHRASYPGTTRRSNRLRRTGEPALTLGLHRRISIGALHVTAGVAVQPNLGHLDALKPDLAGG